MSQTEDMKRLLLNGRIVGWERREMFKSEYPPLDEEMGISYRWASDKHSERFLSFRSHGNPSYDSFEQGIEVNGEWWFEGDIIQLTVGYYKAKRNQHIQDIIILERGCLKLEKSQIPLSAYVSDWKRISSIHEGE